ncbi:site-specific integrase [Acinetobacter indicus]|uniref:hypothetical protein n=1 Tax=Acinetobacter indicus TaxID=756892 RepID=UPI000CEC4A3E|nr:hypothetical protein [Acinetobacter indicus]
MDNQLINDDSTVLQIDFNNKYPEQDRPISFDKDGQVLSRFSNDIWDFSTVIRGYEANATLDFSEAGTGLNKETLIHLRLIILHNWLYNRDSKDIITFKTLKNKYSVYRSLASFFKGKNSSFLYMNKNGIAQRKYLEKLSLNKKSRIDIIISFIKSMNKAGTFFNLGNNFGVDQDFMKKIEKIKLMAVSSTKQTILIPSRIYSEFINSSLEVFQNFNNNLCKLKKYFEEEFPTLTRYQGRHPETFLKSMASGGLLAYCEYFNVRTKHQLVYNLTLIQTLGFFMVGCFTGMRKTEILNLGQNCLQQKIIEDREVYVLNGYTSKTSSTGVRKATWITSKTIFPIIDTLKGLHSIIKNICDHYGLYQNIAIHEYPLFPHIPIQKIEAQGFHSQYKHPPTLLYSIDNTFDLLKGIDIRQDDINELERFNPLINWGEEYKIEVGEKWKFRPHQFRRSLVVYAIRSGMIQLAVLKKQLQHLTVDMTAYYGNSSATASNLFEDNLIEEFKEENSRFQFIQYDKKVIETKDVLFGGEGTRLSIVRSKNPVPEYLLDKQKTLQYFKEGRLSYKKTPLGGCSKIGSCDKLGFSYITACIDCKDSIFDSSSKEALHKTKQMYLTRLSKYNVDSITYRQLQIEINSIDKILNKIEMLEINNVKNSR